MAKIKVYRNGNTVVPTHHEKTLAAFAATDAACPAGRVNRSNCLYASVDLNGVARWARANLSLYGMSEGYENFLTRELTVQAEGIYVYSIKAWDLIDIYRNRPSLLPEAIDAYWASGIPLADFAVVAAERDLDTTEWEVLVPVQALVSERTVSAARLIKGASKMSKGSLEDLTSQLKKQARALRFAKAA